MKNYVLLCSLIISILSYGCASNKFIEREDDPDCKTAITGYFNEANIWNTYYPAIVLKNGYLKRALSFQMKEDGLDFVEKKSGTFSELDTVFYPFNEIKTIIDSNANCIYGEIPNAFRIKKLLVQINLIYEQPDYEPIYIELYPGESFSYCVKPGLYKIKDILFLHKDGFDKSVNVPEIKFTARPDSINNIGTLSISRVRFPELPADKNIFYVPYETEGRHTDLFAVIAFGGIGLAASAAAGTSDIYANGCYKIEIKRDEK